MNLKNLQLASDYFNSSRILTVSLKATTLSDTTVSCYLIHIGMRLENGNNVVLFGVLVVFWLFFKLSLSINSEIKLYEQNDCDKDAERFRTEFFVVILCQSLTGL